jgi:hypothetical protein
MPEANLLITSGSSAIFFSVVMQGLKKANWFPWINTTTERLNRIIGIVAAMALSAGIHASYHYGEAGTLIFTLTGFTLVNIKAFVGHAIGQWTAQHGFYKIFVVPPELQAATLNVLKQLLSVEAKNFNLVLPSGEVLAKLVSPELIAKAQLPKG